MKNPCPVLNLKKLLPPEIFPKGPVKIYQKFVRKIFPHIFFRKKSRPPFFLKKVSALNQSSGPLRFFGEWVSKGMVDIAPPPSIPYSRSKPFLAGEKSMWLFRCILIIWNIFPEHIFRKIFRGDMTFPKRRYRVNFNR